MWNIHIFVLLIIIGNDEISALSFNQPNFSSTPNWNPNAVTFADQSIIGQSPRTIFVNTNNTIYVPNRKKNEILVWHEDSINPTRIISGDFSNPTSLFVTSNGDIYIDDGEEKRRVQKWISNENKFVTVMNVIGSCWGLFVDIKDNLYCSIKDHHQVVKRWLDDSVMTLIVAAGTGTAGSASNELNAPSGIFVDVNLDLYVTDCGNGRVQLFQSGQSNVITVVGSKSLIPTISLNCPNGIVLDAQKYLFIVDSGNHRIVGSGPFGFRCLVGCYGEGSQSNQLSKPFSLSFDYFGNMLVTDADNSRIQKFELIELTSVLSFNQSEYCPTLNWNPNAITFADQSIIGQSPLAIFINTNNTIYVANKEKNQILVWHEGSNNPTRVISGDFSYTASLFVTSNGDIYIDDGLENGRVQKWILNEKKFVIVMNVKGRCSGLFVDINDNLYCSMKDHHQVVKRWLSDSVTTSIVVAGTVTPGSLSNELNRPFGIFVDVNLDLYVTDCLNDRVQLFQSGQLNGITVVGSESPIPTIPLNCPSGIVLDAQKRLFIVDLGNHRIVGSGPFGFRCLVGCYGRGSQSNQLSNPFSLGFDHFGNIFVTDQNNHRIQKFQFYENSCGKLIKVE